MLQPDATRVCSKSKEPAQEMGRQIEKSEARNENAASTRVSAKKKGHNPRGERSERKKDKNEQFKFNKTT